jgi:hypothetical protein
LGKSEAYELLNKEDISSEIKIKIKNGENFGDETIVIQNKQVDQKNIGFDELSLVTNKICFTKENLTLPKVTIFKGEKGNLEYKIEMNNAQDFQFEFLQTQLEVIKELIKVSPDFFNENGQVHSANLYKIIIKFIEEAVMKKRKKNLNKIKAINGAIKITSTTIKLNEYNVCNSFIN